MSKILGIVLLTALSSAAVAQEIRNGSFAGSGENGFRWWIVSGNISRESGTELPGLEYRAVMKADLENASSNISKKRAGAARLGQRINDFVPGKTYTLSCYARSIDDGHLFTMGFISPGNKSEGQKLYLNKTWKKYSFSAFMPKDRKLCDIYFKNFHGTVYLAEVSLSSSDQQEVKTIKKELPTGIAWTSSRKNILINSGFELEWQGWMPSGVPNDFSTISPINFDRTVKQSGTCSIRIPKHNGLSSLRYNMDPNTTYTLSFYVRAASDMKNIPKPRQPLFGLFHHSGGKPCRLYLSTLTKEWKRYSLTVQGKDLINENTRGKNNPPYEKNSFFFRVLNFGPEIWVDSVQLEKGPMTAYEPGIDIGFSTAKDRSIYDLAGKSGKAEVIVYHERGLKNNAELRIKANNIYGKKIWQKTYELTSTDKDFSVRNMDFPLELGMIDFETELVCNEREISRGQWRCLGVEKPLHFSNPMLGLCNSIGFRTPLWLISWRLPFFDLLGASIATLDLPQVKEDLTDRLKTVAELHKKHGLTTVTKVLFPTGHKLHALTYKNPKTPYFVEPTPEEDLRYAHEFAQILKDRYKRLNGNIDKIYAMNEPNLGRDKKGIMIKSPARVALIYKTAREELNKIDRNIILAGGINAVDLYYTQGIMAHDGWKYINEMGVHPYRANPESPFLFGELQKMRAFLDQYNKNMTLDNSEQYYAMRSPYQPYGEFGADYASASEADNAGRIVQNFLHDLAAGVPTNYMGVWENIVIYGGVNPLYYSFSFGALRHASKLLNGVKRGSLIEANNSTRIFLFVNAEKIPVVSVNTRKYGKTGTLTLPPGCEYALDVNGNQIKGRNISLSWLPSYLIFKPELPAEVINTAMKNAGYRGLEMPLDIACSTDKENRNVIVTLSNSCSRKLTGSLYLDIPELKPKKVLFSLDPGTSRQITTSLPPGSLKWQNNPKVKYSVECENNIDTSYFKLPVIFAARSRNTVNIDGDLADWKNANWLTLDESKMMRDQKPIPKYAGKKDFSAQLALQWDEKYLYLAVKVSDSDKNFGPGVQGMFYRYDSLQLYFDQKNNAQKDMEYDDDDAVYQIGLDQDRKPVAWLEKAPTGRYVGWANMNTGIDGDILTAFCETPDGYIWEIALPATALQFIPFNEGTITGFSITVHDKDTNSYKSFSPGPTDQTNFKNPAAWKSVKLVK